MELKPGWVDELAKNKRAEGEVAKVGTDPPLWAYLKANGKKLNRLTQERFAEARRRGGLKGGKAKKAKSKFKPQ